MDISTELLFATYHIVMPIALTARVCSRPQRLAHGSDDAVVGSDCFGVESGGNVSGGLFSGRPAPIQAAPEGAVSGRDLAKAVKQLQATVRAQCVQQECSCPSPEPDDWGLRSFLQGLLTGILSTVLSLFFGVLHCCGSAVYSVVASRFAGSARPAAPIKDDAPPLAAPVRRRATFKQPGPLVHLAATPSSLQ